MHEDWKKARILEENFIELIYYDFLEHICKNTATGVMRGGELWIPPPEAEKIVLEKWYYFQSHYF